MCKLKTNQSENGNPQSQKIEKLSREVPRQQRALSAPPLLYKDYQAIHQRKLYRAAAFCGLLSAHKP